MISSKSIRLVLNVGHLFVELEKGEIRILDSDARLLAMEKFDKDGVDRLRTLLEEWIDEDVIK